ncbi:hypothetical protein AGMMS50212_15830 [Spirochaetia bacterium]|nr:hypothetical protein AGMMS50212_15830 [Spirochaetia bacterium]
MTRETRMSKDSLIYPVFVCGGKNIKKEITSMEGQFNLSMDNLPYAYDKMLKALFHKTSISGYLGLPL